MSSPTTTYPVTGCCDASVTSGSSPGCAPAPPAASGSRSWRSVSSDSSSLRSSLRSPCSATPGLRLPFRATMAATSSARHRRTGGDDRWPGGRRGRSHRSGDGNPLVDRSRPWRLHPARCQVGAADRSSTAQLGGSFSGSLRSGSVDSIDRDVRSSERRASASPAVSGCRARRPARGRAEPGAPPSPDPDRSFR